MEEGKMNEEEKITRTWINICKQYGHNYKLPLSFVPIPENLLVTKVLCPFLMVISEDTEISSVDISSNNLSSYNVYYTVSALIGSHNITKIDFSFSNIGDDEIGSIFGTLGCTSITKIKLRKTNIGDDGIKKISEKIKTTQIQEIDLRDNNFTAKGIKNLTDSLKENTGLKKINISYIDFQTVKNIIEIPYLEEVKLKNCDITSIKAIMSSVCKAQIQAITFENLTIRDNEVIKIIEPLQFDSNLKSLKFRNPIISIKELQTLFDFLKNTKIEMVSLRGGELRDEGIETVVNALENNSNIKEVNLRCTGFSSKGLEVISNFLEKNNSLKKLTLTFNKIDDKDLEILCKALVFNRTLSEIDLANNKFTDQGIGILVKLLNTNHTITYLGDIGNKKINDLLLKNKEQKAEFNKTDSGHYNSLFQNQPNFEDQNEVEVNGEN